MAIFHSYVTLPEGKSKVNGASKPTTGDVPCEVSWGINLRYSQVKSMGDLQEPIQWRYVSTIII